MVDGHDVLRSQQLTSQHRLLLPKWRAPRQNLYRTGRFVRDRCLRLFSGEWFYLRYTIGLFQWGVMSASAFNHAVTSTIRREGEKRLYSCDGHVDCGQVLSSAVSCYAVNPGPRRITSRVDGKGLQRCCG